MKTRIVKASGYPLRLFAKEQGLTMVVIEEVGSTRTTWQALFEDVKESRNIGWARSGYGDTPYEAIAAYAKIISNTEIVIQRLGSEAKKHVMTPKLTYYPKRWFLK